MTDPAEGQILDPLMALVRRARAAGADAADAIAIDSTSLTVGRRMDRPEKVEREEARDLGLRVLIGQKQAIVSTTDTSPEALDAVVERAIAMARAVPEDPYAGLAPEDLIGDGAPLTESDDPEEPDIDLLTDRAAAAESAAMAVGGVTNSEGAEASWGRSQVSLVASNGFTGRYAVTRHSLVVSVLAGEGTAMESAYEWSSTVFGADLRDADALGREAGERAVARLNPKKGKTKALPVVFDRRVAGGLVGNLASAINGSAIARGTSFLREKMGAQIFPQGVTVREDPFRRRGLRSRAFDAEGLTPAPRDIIADGVLTGWILDLRTARQLGLASTGNASRGTGGPPSPSASNLSLLPGAQSPAAMIADIEEGVFIDTMFGTGVNLITGDYSRGFSGFWIENGALTYPVSEMTVAGNLLDIFARITPADDLEHKTGIDAPTVRIDGMTVAGN